MKHFLRVDMLSCLTVLLPQAVEELGAVSLNELHDFVAARWRGAVPAAQARPSHDQLHLTKAAQELFCEHSQRFASAEGMGVHTSCKCAVGYPASFSHLCVLVAVCPRLQQLCCRRT